MTTIIRKQRVRAIHMTDNTTQNIELTPPLEGLTQAWRRYTKQNISFQSFSCGYYPDQGVVVVWWYVKHSAIKETTLTTGSNLGPTHQNNWNYSAHTRAKHQNKTSRQFKTATTCYFRNWRKRTNNNFKRTKSQLKFDNVLKIEDNSFDK